MEIRTAFGVRFVVKIHQKEGEHFDLQLPGNRYIQFAYGSKVWACKFTFWGLWSDLWSDILEKAFS